MLKYERIAQGRAMTIKRNIFYWVLSVCCLSSPVLATGSGPYLGLQLGHERASFDPKTVNLGGGPNSLPDNYVKLGGSSGDAVVGAVAGYRLALVGGLYTAFEVEYLKHRAKVSSHGHEFTFNEEYGMGALLGFSINETVSLYGRAGMSRLNAKWKIPAQTAKYDPYFAVCAGIFHLAFNRDIPAPP